MTVTEDGRTVEPHHHCPCGCGAHFGCFFDDSLERELDEADLLPEAEGRDSQ